MSGHQRGNKKGCRVRLIRILAIIICIFYPFCSKAEKLSLEECVKRALESYPSLQKSRYEVESSLWRLKEAKLRRWPSMELENLMGIVPDAEGDAITGETIDDEYGFFNKLDVKMALPLVTFGRIGHGIKAAQEALKSQEAAYRSELDEVVLRVHELYYGYLLTSHLMDSTGDLLERFQEAYTIAQERLEKNEPNVTEADVLKLKIGLEGVSKGMRKLERQRQTVIASLLNLIGWDKSEEEFATEDKQLKPVKIKLLDLSEYEEMAKENNARIKQLEAAVQAAKEEYMAEKAKYYPMLLAVGGVKYAVAPGREDQDNPFLNDEYNYFSAGAALAVKWNMNILETRAEVEQKRARYLSLERQLEEARRGIMVKVREAYEKVKETEKNLDSSWEARKAGRALLILNFTNFKFGIGSGKDVFDGLSIYARTAGQYYESVYDYNMAVAQLKQLTGQLYKANNNF
ncbi:TolC family protein [Thermodesulforhabdus norvegica]|uniref:Outer membrane protein TolC n=1 Tax=Thermodesulforhabdus norvegica TaxID=39841 RepID=A0A1I4R9U0_9BACT|nr:TolC family protein [Thermodesulforhabdus norvegica]SFM48979.1 Outer membrane protein TolC [Thermodesulforhabdus norvegica]